MFKISAVVLMLSSYAFSSMNTNVIGGEIIDKSKWKEVVRISNGRARCTATIIGKRALLTAAHCTEQDGTIEPVSSKDFYSFVLESDCSVRNKNCSETLFQSKCTIAPHYKREVGDQDMALCLIDRDVPVKPAKISSESPKIGESVILIGFGCIYPGGHGGNDGFLRMGLAPVISLTKPDWYSFRCQGNVAVCYGDSGGPTFKKPSVKDSHRIIYGVTSRGNMKDLSLLTAVFHPDSLEFIRQFEDEHDIEICGSKACL